MPSKEKDSDLINHFVDIEPIAGLRIDGRHDFRRQIIGRRAIRDLCQPFSCQVTDQLPDHLRRSQGFAFKEPRHPARAFDEGRKVQNRLRALVGAKFVKYAAGDVVFDRN